MAKSFKGMTHIAVVIDQSGSMESVKEEVVSGFNQWKSEVAKEGGNVQVSVTLFDTRVYTPIISRSLCEVPVMALFRTGKIDGIEDGQEAIFYHPNGMTTLLDSFMAAIKAVEPSVKKKDRVLVLTITDGRENSSRHHTKADVLSAIKDRTDRGNWTFTYLSADANAFADAGSYGVTFGNTSIYTATQEGTQAAMHRLTRATRGFVGMPSASTEDFYGDVDQGSGPEGAQKPRGSWVGRGGTGRGGGVGGG